MISRQDASPGKQWDKSGTQEMYKPFFVCSDWNKGFLHISWNLFGAGKMQVSKSSCSAGHRSRNSWSWEPRLLCTWMPLFRHYSMLPTEWTITIKKEIFKGFHWHIAPRFFTLDCCTCSSLRPPNQILILQHPKAGFRIRGVISLYHKLI